MLDVILEVLWPAVKVERQFVSILIVLDVILEARDNLLLSCFDECFNPYCVGCNLRSDIVSWRCLF